MIIFLRWKPDSGGWKEFGSARSRLDEGSQYGLRLPLRCPVLNSLLIPALFCGSRPWAAGSCCSFKKSLSFLLRRQSRMHDAPLRGGRAEEAAAQSFELMSNKIY